LENIVNSPLKFEVSYHKSKKKKKTKLQPLFKKHADSKINLKLVLYNHGTHL